MNQSYAIEKCCYGDLYVITMHCPSNLSYTCHIYVIPDIVLQIVINRSCPSCASNTKCCL